MDAAYALLHVKAFDAATRQFSGLASTPELDRQGHILEPAGATFRNPLPLLLHHDRTQPVGTVELSRTPQGLAFTATMPTIDTPGRLRERVDEAWQTIKAGLIWGVSIGFRVLDDGFRTLKSGGLHITKSEILELSLVTIPANAQASILTVKSLAASGLHLPGVAGLPVVRAVKAAPAMKQTTAEQITAFERTRATKSARMVELMQTAADEGTTLDAAQTEEYDGLELEVKNIDAHLTRLRAFEQTQIAAAMPVLPPPLLVKPALPVISVKSTLAPGTGFVRYVKAMAVSRGNRLEAAEYAKQWKDSTPEVELILKAAVAAGTTTDATWAGPLVQLQNLTSEFLELLRPATVLGRIPGLRTVPFNVSIPAQTAGGTYQWVGQGAPKPVGKLAFTAITLAITKCAGIIVITEELARTSSPSAEATIRADMIAGIAAFLDLEFTDPTKAAVANVSPGSITNGVTPLTSSGTSSANARSDVQALLAAINAAGLSTAGAVLLMSESNALALGFALNPLGQPLFPGIGANGGTAMGLTVVTSNALGAHVIALQPAAIFVADDGGVTIDASREASVQMDSAPDNPASATTVLTSFWQNNLIGLRAERFINWKKARAGAVQYLDQTYIAA